MSSVFHSLLVLSLPAFALPVIQIPPATQVVLAKHGLEPDRLPAFGVVLREDGCFRLDDKGGVLEPALTPEQLDSWLSLQAGSSKDGQPHRADQETLPPIETVGGIFDGGAAAPDPGAVVAVPPYRPYQEPEFDPSWDKIRARLWGTNPAKGVATLAARFSPSDDTLTGLSEQAPEALRLLAFAIHNGKGGDKTAAELRRELAVVANLKPAQKTAFVTELKSPLTVYVALSRSHAPHSLDSQLYFDRMVELLGRSGRILTRFIREQDPEGAHASEFLLRAAAYDALMPYLREHPREAGAVAPFFFQEGSSAKVRARASQLEGFFTELAAQGRWDPALESYASALAAIASHSTDEKTARRAALYLKVNEDLLPARQRAAVDALAAKLPEKLLENEGLVPPDPRELWPWTEWRFAVHFASTGTYKGWVSRFESQGYEKTAAPGGIVVSKSFGKLKVILVPKLYQGDAEGFLRGAEARRFLAGVAKDLRDPAVHGVILRNHAQFHLASLVDGRTNPGKLVIDGSCRSAWDLQVLRRKCPACSFIVNTGTGYGQVNNDAVIAVVEGLARGEDWSEIHKDWARHSRASAARMQGPWTPPFAEALKLLEKEEAKPRG